MRPSSPNPIGQGQATVGGPSCGAAVQASHHSSCCGAAPAPQRGPTTSATAIRAASAGAPVQVWEQGWDCSLHVAHLRQYPEQYRQVVAAFLESCLVEMATAAREVGGPAGKAQDDVLRVGAGREGTGVTR